MAPVDSRDYVLGGIYYSVLEPRRCGKHNVACQHATLVWKCLLLAASTSRHRPNVSSNQYFMLTGARAHSVWCAVADNEMEVSAYFISVHIPSCDRQKGAQRRQRKLSIYLIYK